MSIQTDAINLDEVLEDFFALSKKIKKLHGNEETDIRKVEALGGSGYIKMKKSEVGKFVKLIFVPEEELDNMKNKIKELKNQETGKECQ